MIRLKGRDTDKKLTFYFFTMECKNGLSIHVLVSPRVWVLDPSVLSGRIGPVCGYKKKQN